MGDWDGVSWVCSGAGLMYLGEGNLFEYVCVVWESLRIVVFE